MARLPSSSQSFVSPQAGLCRSISRRGVVVEVSTGRLTDSKTARKMYWKWVEPTVPEARRRWRKRSKGIERSRKPIYNLIYILYHTLYAST